MIPTVDVLKSSISRTLTPVIVGLFISTALKFGFEIGDADKEAFETWVGAGLSFAVIGLYYVIARVIETKYPKFTWLLGSKKLPTSYAEKPEVTPGEVLPTTEPEVVTSTDDSPRHSL